jgi:hypothetical protein
MVIFAVESFGFFVRADRMKLSSARTVTTGGAVDNVDNVGSVGNASCDDHFRGWGCR